MVYFARCRGAAATEQGDTMAEFLAHLVLTAALLLIGPGWTI